MGSVWCKADRPQQNRSFSPKSPFNTTIITKWTNQVCQVYKRPKDGRRPPRHPQRPTSRSGERPSISHPHPVTEDINKGWQNATLVVPDYAPIPPPRKKRKRKLQQLERNALSMNHLNRNAMFDHSTISLPDRIESEEFSRSSSTFVIRPILENDDYEVLRKYDSPLNGKENSIAPEKPVRDGLEPHQMYYEIPHNTYANNKTGFVSPSVGDKLSDISEEYNHSDDNQNKQNRAGKASEVTEAKRGSEMNILQHIYNISNVSKLSSNTSEDQSDSKDKPKATWLKNILSTNETNAESDRRRHLDRNLTSCSQRDRLHLMNGEEEAAAPDASGNKTPPTTPTREYKSACSFSYDSETTQSALLEILNKNSKLNDRKEIIETEEKLFQRNIRSNVIYRSSSTDKLADESFINSTPKSKTLEYTPKKYEYVQNKSKSYMLTPPLYRRHTYHSDMPADVYNPFEEYRRQTDTTRSETTNAVENSVSTSTSRFSKQNIGRNPYIVQYKDYIGSTNRSYLSALRDLEFSGMKSLDALSNKTKDTHQKPNTLKSASLVDENVNTEKRKPGEESKPNSLLNNQSSPLSSSRSSITDSLQEFEMSIYDMLKESKRNSDSSDDEDLKKNKVKTEKPNLTNTLTK